MSHSPPGTQLALVFHGPHDVRLERVPLPAVQDASDVVVRITLCGLCGSDMHPFHGREAGLDPGTTCGHEFVGRVQHAGPAVRRWKPGDRVMSPFTTCCGACFYCAEGLTARCPEARLFGWVQGGHGLQGAQAQWVRVPQADATLCAVPDAASDEEALLLGDVLSTGWFAADNAGIGQYAAQRAQRAGAAAGGDGGHGVGLAPAVAVVGCGPVGLMAVLASRELGAGVVLAVDSVPERLSLAARFGGVAVDRSACDVAAAVRGATGGRGADVVIEAVGTPAAFALACELVRPGGVVSSCGCHTEAAAPLSELYNKNLTLKSGRCPARMYMDRLLPLVASKRLPITDIITHRLPLRAEAYRLFDGKRDGCIKVVFDPWRDDSGPSPG